MSADEAGSDVVVRPKGAVIWLTDPETIAKVEALKVRIDADLARRKSPPALPSRNPLRRLLSRARWGTRTPTPEGTGT